MSSPSNLGLGRLVSPRDSRDFRLQNFLGLKGHGLNHDPIELLALAAQEFKKTTITYRRWAATQYEDVTATHWWKGFSYLAQAQELLKPTPPPPSASVVWLNDSQLDQGDTPHCVGFSTAQWGNTLPIDDNFTNDDGHAIYYECKIVDGEPREENGSYVRTAAQVLQARKRLNAYAFASTTDEITEFVRTSGPIIVGTTWLEDMFYPDPDGYVTATGEVAGGHAYLLCWYLESEDAYLFQNSWGSNWGIDGRFKIKVHEFQFLMNDWGEACAAVELPL